MTQGARHVLVAFDHRVETQDAGGGISPTWREYARRWASVAAGDANERTLADRVMAIGAVEVLLDYDPELADACVPTDRIRLLESGRPLYIVSCVNVAEQNRALRIICRETLE